MYVLFCEKPHTNGSRLLSYRLIGGLLFSRCSQVAGRTAMKSSALNRAATNIARRYDCYYSLVSGSTEPAVKVEWRVAEETLYIVYNL